VLRRELQAQAEGLAVPLMLWGPPGVGKSDLVVQAAAAFGWPLIDLRLSQLEPSDLRGMPFREAGEAWVRWAPPAFLPDAARDGPCGVLFLDEVNAALPNVAAAAYQLVLDRRVGDYCLPPGWAVLAAGNRLRDGGVTYPLPAPLANRLMHLEVEPDLDDWLAWAEAAGIDPALRRFLAAAPEWLCRPEPPVDGPQAFATPRSWVFADRALKKFADPGTRFELLRACVGESAAAAFLAWHHTPGAEDAPPPDLPGQLAWVEQTLPAIWVAGMGEGEALAAVGPLLLRAESLHPEAALPLARRLWDRFGAQLYQCPEWRPWAVRLGQWLQQGDPAP